MERTEITLSGWFRDKNRLVYGIVFLVLAILLLIDLVPLFRISAYNIPCADDYRYGTLTHEAWESTGSVIEVMKAAATQVKTSYYSWQGTFSAIFLMALQPAVFGEQLYWVGTLIMLLSLSIGTIYFCFVLFTGVCGFDKYISGIIGTVVTLLCIELVPYPSQAFYWYNGSIFYTFYHGVFLFAVGLGIRTVQKGGWWRLALLCLLAAFIGGGELRHGPNGRCCWGTFYRVLGM